MAPKHKPKNNNKPKNTPSNNTKRQDHSDSSSSGVNKTSNNTMSEPNVGRSLNSNNQANSNNGNNNIRRNTSTSSITSTDSNSSNDGSNSPLPNQRRNNINPSNSKKNNNLSNNNSISPTSPSNHQTKRRQHVPPPLNTNLTPKPSERIELVWTSVKTSFKPPVRGFHSCTLVGDKLYIIGGDNRVEHFKDVWIYDLKNNYWIKITENSHLPMPRTGHSAVLYQDKVYLFGGKNENYYTSDLFIYDLKDKVWVKDVQPHNKKVSLTPRAAHSCCCVDDKMYIFGGITSYQANDGRKASEYIDVLSMYDISQRRWKKPKNKGTAPSARAGHSCCVINRDIYIFGGRQGTILFNDLYKYNVDSEKWTKIQTKGDAPQPSAGHTMSAYVDKIVILGGSDWKTYPTEIYVFHIPSKVWIKCMSLGITTGRFWHTATVYDDNLYVYGGGTGELVDDMYCINLRSLNNISEATALTPQSSASPVPLPEIPVQTFTSTLKFKTIYKAEMRVFAKVPRDVTYLELKETISKSYGFPVVLKYVELDDEKDEITIGSDRELKDFIECFEEMGKGLRLELSEQKAREPESDTDSNSETDHEEDMQSTTDGIKWRKGGLLGKGAYGEVYKGLNVNTGQWMAVKIIDLSATSEKEQKLVEKQIFNEINLMKDLCHENIVRYLGAEFNRKKTRLFIYIELVDGGSLSEILKNVGPLDESVVRQYTRQILFGLKYLHDKNIIHRDIKGGNILIETKSGTIKLADFGHSKKITENVQASLRICGTPMWMAPEIIKESKYSKASDIWSVACTIIEMLTAEVPFPDLVSFENTGVMFKIATGAVPKIPENLSEEGKLFLGKCFSQNPNSRPTVDDLLHEPFLRSLRYVGVSYPNDETSSEEEEEEDDEFPSIDNSSYEEDTNSFDKGKRPISTESEEFDGMENPNPNNKGKGPLVEDEEDEDEDFTDEDEDEDEDFSDDESESSYSEDKSSQSITQQLRNIQANSSLEDQGQVFTSPSATYVGVYDGHGGPEASRFITQHLFPFLHKFASEHGGLSAEVIKKAFDATEEEFLHLVKRSWPARPQIASVGSCCLVGAIANDVLYVANLGDSRAVLGRRVSPNGPNNQVVAERLSTDHNVAVEEVRKEVVALHPDDSHVVVYNHGVWRIKGIIQVSRSIGDMYLKKPEFIQQFGLPIPLKRPVMTAEPSILSRKLKPQDLFLIFASDGLWEQLSDQVACEIVLKSPRVGIARRLVRAAVQEAAKKREMRYDDIKRIEKGVRRHFHDDITVIVIYLDHPLSSSNGRFKEDDFIDCTSAPVDIFSLNVDEADD